MHPNSNLTHYIYKSKLNSYGFRDAEYDLEPTKDTIRIAIVGDSFTFGYGLENQEDTYVKQLEKILNANSRQKYEVLNFGTSGANILDVYWLLKYKILEFNPDIVIYGFFPNDLEFHQNNLDINFCLNYKYVN